MAAPRAAKTIGGVLVLAACGFHPLCGDNGATAETAGKLAMIYVDPIPDNKLGYELRNELIDLFDASGDPSKNVYRLRVTINTKSEGVAIQNDAAITRYNDTLTVTYSLTDANHQVIDQGHRDRTTVRLQRRHLALRDADRAAERRQERRGRHRLSHPHRSRGLFRAERTAAAASDQEIDAKKKMPIKK